MATAAALAALGARVGITGRDQALSAPSVFRSSPTAPR